MKSKQTMRVICLSTLAVCLISLLALVIFSRKAAASNPDASITSEAETQLIETSTDGPQDCEEGRKCSGACNDILRNCRTPECRKAFAQCRQRCCDSYECLRCARRTD